MSLQVSIISNPRAQASSHDSLGSTFLKQCLFLYPLKFYSMLEPYFTLFFSFSVGVWPVPEMGAHGWFSGICHPWKQNRFDDLLNNIEISCPLA